MPAQPVAQARIALEQGDQIEPGLNPGPVEQRRAQVGGEQAGTGAGHGAVDRGEQAAGARARGGDGQLEALPRRRVDHHMIAGRAGDRRPEEGQRFPRHLVQISEQSPGGAKRGALELAEAVQSRDLEPFLQPTLRRGGIEARLPEAGALQWLVRNQFCRIQPRQLRIQRAGQDRGQFEPPGRNIGGRQAVALPDPRHRDEPVGRARIEQRLLGERPRRHHADDRPVHHRFGAALLRFRRAFDLLGNGDAVAGLDQAGEIGFRRMDGHAAHRDRRAVMLAARGERDVEAGGGDPGVVEEQFEEVAHPVEEQRPLGLRLQRQILRHHRGRLPACLRLCGHEWEDRALTCPRHQ